MKISPVNGSPLLLSLVLCLLLTPETSRADAGFRQWIATFYTAAHKAGISKVTYDAVFGNVTDPDPEVLAAARYQPEFVTPVGEYLDTRVNDRVIQRGLAKAKEYRQWLDRIEKKFGVDRTIVLAIWSMESSYGEALKRQSVLRNVIRSLATLAYADPRRKKFARSQLIAAMRIVQNGDVTVKGLRGSWAGAMGHTQFIPTSYERWAVDIDADGRRNVWTSVPDALASAANLLADNGWRRGEPWGYEVRLPENFDYGRAEQAGFSLSQWRELGLLHADGSALPDTAVRAVLKLLGGAKGPVFLLLKNFFVIKRYNNADKYALAVGYLSARLKGGKAFSRAWPREATALSFKERMEVQSRLSELGLYSGDIDGAIGPVSRKSIREYQQRIGVVADGLATVGLLREMREGDSSEESGQPSSSLEKVLPRVFSADHK